MILVVKQHIKRWWKFQREYKKQDPELYGKKTLCRNVSHPYHDSKFEALTCRVLHKFYPAEKILVPEQHGCKTKFDFVIPGVAVIEPHGVWENKKGEIGEYTRKRVWLANQEEMTKGLQVIVVGSMRDLKILDKKLKEFSNKRKEKRRGNLIWRMVIIYEILLIMIIVL
ncbi:MAG: hypothetical protein HeimC3_35710 [Candidatus Heimdallarchaeota archaeon LC_3]|nr:MAG: hypothetical protein HeimC3_35710 [Candidatus Heimdallarchaeota archaeon LC_3]